MTGIAVMIVIVVMAVELLSYHIVEVDITVMARFAAMAVVAVLQFSSIHRKDNIAGKSALQPWQHSQQCSHGITSAVATFPVLAALHNHTALQWWNIHSTGSIATMRALQQYYAWQHSSNYSIPANFTAVAVYCSDSSIYGISAMATFTTLAIFQWWQHFTALKQWQHSKWGPKCNIDTIVVMIIYSQACCQGTIHRKVATNAQAFSYCSNVSIHMNGSIALVVMIALQQSVAAFTILQQWLHCIVVMATLQY